MSVMVVVAIIGIVQTVMFATVVPFAVWIVKRDKSCALSIEALRNELTKLEAKFEAKFVTWEFIKEFREHQDKQEEVRRLQFAALQKEMQGLGESMAFLKGKLNGHASGG